MPSSKVTLRLEPLFLDGVRPQSHPVAVEGRGPGSRRKQGKDPRSILFVRGFAFSHAVSCTQGKNRSNPGEIPWLNTFHSTHGSISPGWPAKGCCRAFLPMGHAIWLKAFPRVTRFRGLLATTGLERRNNNCFLKS